MSLSLLIRQNLDFSCSGAPIFHIGIAYVHNQLECVPCQLMSNIAHNHLSVSVFQSLL